MRKHIINKRLSYTVLNRYNKKRLGRRKAVSVLNCALQFNPIISVTTFLRAKKTYEIAINKKMLKIIAISEPVSFELLTLMFGT